jgi:hypothetical protein
MVSLRLSEVFNPFEEPTNPFALIAIGSRRCMEDIIFRACVGFALLFKLVDFGQSNRLQGP